MPGREVIQAPLVRTVGVAQFDAAVWEKCEPVTIAHLWSGAPAPVARQAEVRICWSDEALHVRFVCNQHEPLVVSAEPQTERKTLGLWDRDVCEIFVAPNPATPARYFEFNAAPTGEWVDLGILVTPEGRETDWEFRSGLQTAAQIESTIVRVALVIPWS